ncbi:hypothetical protein ACF1A9_20030 [Streptomyces sp. NPDC014872]|uniref:hypothetical protein n=1 Tax=Streptomyces sp. NPDC014872 TaxID=3364926 RepID=UPI0037003F7B
MTPPPQAHTPAPPASPVQVAYYGLGQLFALVVLDPMPVWSRPPQGQPLPERTGEGHELLAVRWCGFQDVDDEVLTALTEAAERAPHSPVATAELAQYQASLADHLRMVALPASTILGPWAQRPGASASHPRPARHTESGTPLLCTGGQL